MSTILKIAQPDDFHLHIRDGPMMRMVLPLTSNIFARAIIMPNLKPPVATTALAAEYRERIMAAVPSGQSFEPLMTLYLTSFTTPADIEAAKASGFVHGVKWYPVGATTNSEGGVSDEKAVAPVLAAMEKVGMPLLIHGEVTDCDIFDRERRFITEKLIPLLEAFPNLRVVVEHVTTKEMVEFVTHSKHPHLAATITPHHLMYSRQHLFKPPMNQPGTALNPHLFCLPVLKTDEDRTALVTAAVSGNPRFFAGTDSAPHPRSSKESSCCSAGVFCGPVALEAYTTVFDDNNALDKLEPFMSHFGADFYCIPRNTRTVTLIKTPTNIPATYTRQERTADGQTVNVEVVPMCANMSLPWTAKLE